MYKLLLHVVMSVYLATNSCTKKKKKNLVSMHNLTQLPPPNLLCDSEA